jgi:hypothetical protein
MPSNLDVIAGIVVAILLLIYRQSHQMQEDRARKAMEKAKACVLCLEPHLISPTY